MAFIWGLLNDTLCQEDLGQNPPKNFQQYSPDLGSSRPNPPYASRPNASQAASKPVLADIRQVGMSEQQGASAADGWSKTPPQARNGPASQASQTRTRGAQSGRPGDNAAGWSSKPPPSGRQPQQQSNQARPQQDAASPRGQASSQQATASRQTSAPTSKQAAREQQMRNRQGKQQQQPEVFRETREREDTVIGRGFTAAMKRGVAQAKPTPMHEEMVPQKDGGFVATIQRGFEGLFGKPTSKEEVLRKRGAVLANEYEAVPGDEIDQRVQFFARRLPEDVAGCLMIFRDAKGKYKINEEEITMEIRFRQNAQGGTDKEIFVFWTTEEGEQSDPEPLGLFLSHAANVAYEVKQGGNIITQVPDHVRMSFHEEKGTKLTDGSADARFNAMEVAARQAKMREEAAMEWRQKQSTKGAEPEEEAPASKAEASQIQERQPSAEGGFLEAALAAVNARLPPALAAPAAAPPPAPFADPGRPAVPAPQMPGFGQANQMTFASIGAPSAAGTFYGVGQVPPVRQGTMYAYGSAAPPSVMASASGYPAAMAPMQRQGTMYAYGSATPIAQPYAVPVR